MLAVYCLSSVVEALSRSQEQVRASLDSWSSLSLLSQDDRPWTSRYLDEMTGVWDSPTCGKVLWYRINTPVPIYLPCGRFVKDGSELEEIPEADFMPLFILLNTAFLRDGGVR